MGSPSFFDYARNESFQLGPEGLQFAFNDEPFENVGVVSTAETVSTFYAYDTENPASAAHGFYEASVASFFFHENTNTQDISLVATFNAPNAGGNEGNISTSFSTSVSYEVTDGENLDSFSASGAFNTYQSDKTDGYAITGFDENTLSFSKVSGISDFRYYTGQDWVYFNGVPSQLRVQKSDSGS